MPIAREIFLIYKGRAGAGFQSGNDFEVMFPPGIHANGKICLYLEIQIEWQYPL